MVEATFESGVGDLNTPNPQIRLETAKDGRSFNQELSRGLGGIGEFNKRQIWYRLGRFPRMTTFKFTMSDPVKPVFISLTAKVRAGTRGR
jgi:hypothetical protein